MKGTGTKIYTRWPSFSSNTNCSVVTKILLEIYENSVQNHICSDVLTKNVKTDKYKFNNTPKNDQNKIKWSTSVSYDFCI